MDINDIIMNSDSMNEWKTQMHDLNITCAEEISTINTKLSTLVNNYFKGDYADSFNESITKFAQTVKTSHESMASIENFLTNIYDVMSNQ